MQEREMDADENVNRDLKCTQSVMDADENAARFAIQAEGGWMPTEMQVHRFAMQT
jgi:hypothetical protein